MRYITLSIFFALIYFSSFGQKIRFTDTTNTWHVRSTDFDGTYHHYYDAYYYWGDSLYNSLTYKKMWGVGYPFSNPHGGPTLIREDTTLNKVYILINDSEQVLMNYNLVVGDIISHTNYENDTSKLTVSDLDSTLIKGTWYKIWRFTTVTAKPASYTVLEGIGCLNGPLYINDPVIGLIYFDLRCFSNHGINPNVSPPVDDYFDNDLSCNASLKTSLVLSNNVLPLVTPNPITETTKLLLPQLASGTFTIYNSLGQMIINVTFQNKKELVFGNKIVIPGIYFYKVIDDKDKAGYSGKFIYR